MLMGAEKVEDLNYGIIVDAGSSGSRGFVYVWPPHSGNPRQLLRIEPLTDDLGYPVLKKITPGLSSVADEPQVRRPPHPIAIPINRLPCAERDGLHEAPSRLPLGENTPKQAQGNVPFHPGHGRPPPHPRRVRLHSQLPYSHLTSAPWRPREAILDNLRREVGQHYDFIVMDQHIQMISGKWEGIFSWIAVNYALDKLAPSAAHFNTTAPGSPPSLRRSLSFTRCLLFSRGQAGGNGGYDRHGRGQHADCL